jgi:hypothetical protein
MAQATLDIPKADPQETHPHASPTNTSGNDWYSHFQPQKIRNVRRQNPPSAVEISETYFFY